jgi:outer membrane protein insertion porin family
MSKRFLLCLSLTTSPLLYSGEEPPPIAATYDRMPIENISVLVEQLPANASFDSKTVLNKLKTRPGDPFSQSSFDDDLKALSEEYDRIEPLLEIHNGRLYITLKVWLRPIIRSIQWDGNSHISTKTLQKELDVKPNTPFNRQTFNKSFHKVKEYYVKKGYFESILQYKVLLDPKTSEVDILVHVEEGRAGKIGNITFEGFSKEEESQLLEMIYTKKYNFLLSWVTGSGIYREEALEQDQLTVVNFLQNKGYADAKVKILIKEAAKPGKIVIDIQAQRGELYHFGKIAFNGNKIFSDAEVESQFLARPGEIYSPEKLRQTAQNIKDLCGRKGYIEANVQYETKLVSKEPTYNVEFWISEGDQYKIGLVHVIGNAQTQTHVILRESLLIPGETFDSAKLKATQQRLENIGYFKSVNVYAVKTQDDVLLGENYRDVYIEVDETTTGSASLFFGYSSADSGFGGLDLSESNFNIAGVKDVFKDGVSALRGGGEFVRARLTLGGRQTSYNLSWMTPYLRDSLWRFGVDTNYTRSDLQSKDYHINTLGSSVYASYPLNTYWTFGTKYRIKNNNTHVSPDTSKQEQAQAGKGGILSAVSSSITFDSTDSAIKPRRGFRSFIEAEFAGLGGDTSFLRFGYINSYYTPIWRYGTMKYRCDLRFIEPVWKTHSPNQIYMSERFFLGGENSVRGYHPFRIGEFFKGTNDPKGGISSTLISIEYLQTVTKMLDVFVFADAGAISMHRFNIPLPNLSYGIGARIDLLNRIPMVVGVGFPVNPRDKDQVENFFFSMGGQF